MLRKRVNNFDGQSVASPGYWVVIALFITPVTGHFVKLVFYVSCVRAKLVSVRNFKDKRYIY